MQKENKSSGKSVVLNSILGINYLKIGVFLFVMFLALFPFAPKAKAAINQCPYNGNANTTVVNFNTRPTGNPLSEGKIFVTNQKQYVSTFPSSVNLAPGQYKVSLYFYDDSADSQPNERWFVRFLNSSGGVVATSDISNDLPDSGNPRFLNDPVNASLTINSSIASVQGWHADYNNPASVPDQISYGSLFPVCASFEKIDVVTPISVNLTANPSSMTLPENSTNLFWTTTGNPTSCTASGEWSGGKNTNGGNESKTGLTAGNHTFTITCNKNGTGSVSDTVFVTVNNQQIQPPTVELTADEYSVSYNGSTTLRWTSTNATSCTASGGWSGSKGLVGSSSTGNLTNTTTYTITCSNSVGSDTDTVTVVVGNNNVLPPIVNLTADQTIVTSGNSTTIRWNPTNSPTSCSASNGTNSWAGSRSVFGGSFYTGALYSNTTFTMTCSNSAGSSTESVTIVVNNQNNQQPTVTISADRTNISYNESTTIRWYPNNATSCYGSGGTNGWANSRSTFSDSFFTGQLSYTTTYTITCSNSSGSDTKSVTVVVGNQQTTQPTVTTNNATNITAYSATLNGSVNGNGVYATAWFEYGTNTSFGYSTPQNSYGSGFSSYSAPISGLTQNTTYYFRAVAQSSQGIIYGSTLSFYTLNDFIVVNNIPTVVITADNSNLAYNGSTFIRWYTTNATSCFASGGSIGWAGTKSIGPGSFYTGSLTSSRTYTIVCSNNSGSATDSVSVGVRSRPVITTTTTTRPAPTSLVLITSSVDRNQPIIPTIDNTRPHPGDEINYTVSYQNVGTGSVTNLNLRIDLPFEVDYITSNPINPNRSGNTLIFSLGTLRANGQGTVTVRVRVRDNIPPGTNLNFPATLSYVDPSGYPQSVFANISAQVWTGDTTTTIVPDNSAALGANVFGAGFLPSSIFEWLLLLILILILVLLGRYLFSDSFRNKTTTVIHE